MYKLHVNSGYSVTSSDVSDKLADAANSVSRDIDGFVILNIEYSGTSDTSEFFYKVEFDFDLEESDIGDHSWAAVLDRLTDELRRHSLFEEFELEDG